MKKLAIILSFILVFTNSSYATHLMGGEITWKCIKVGPDAGKLIFTVKVYRDCQGVAIGTSMALEVHNHPGLTSINLTYMGANELSPTCNVMDGPNSAFSCGGVNSASMGNGVGAVEEHIYQSDAIRIIGTPDPYGWHFTWSSCCRNAAIDNLVINGGSSPAEGFTLRAVMYPYVDSLGIVQPSNNNCYDSSPKFYEQPRTILEVGNGYDQLAFSNGFTYSHNAFDEEQDSLYYSWGQPLDGYNYLNPNSTALPFNAPYSFNNPINGIVLNPVSGRTWYPADQQGNFVTCTNVTSYKCGQKVAEIFREIQVVLIPKTCNLGDTTNGNFGADTLCNIRPLVQPPFFYPATPAPYQWDTLVHCGDTVKFDFIANDNDVYPNGSHQDLQFTVSGGQFMDYNVIPPALCNNPPCATFVEQLTGATPPFITSGGTGTGYFEWITSCNHIVNSCVALRPSVYTFVIKVQDDFCPAPAIENTSQVITITVYPNCSNLKIFATTVDASCGMNNGSAQANPSGGTPPYITYWSDLNGLPVNSSALAAGDYIVRVTDSTFCESIDTVKVSGGLGPMAPTSILSGIAVSCNGDNDGSITSVQTGGQTPYSLLWSTGDTTQSIYNLSAGTYTLSVYDANNCITSDSITITEPLAVQATTVNSNGVLIGTSSGGTPPYTYEFFGTNGLVASSSNNFGNNFSVTPIASGNYTFFVIDANGCTDSVSINFSINFSPTVLVSLSNTYCDSLTDLTIDVSQDSGEVDMSTALFQSTSGAFDITNMAAGDTIGVATLMSGGISLNTLLMVTTVINTNTALICTNDSLLGCVGSFQINNTPGSGISILTNNTVPDGNNYTSGNMSSITFENCFINPCGSFTFNSTINSELGDIYFHTASFGTSSIYDFSRDNMNIHPNPSSGKIILEMNELSNDSYNVIINNMIGQTVYSIEANINGYYRKEIDISKYGKGTYLISISNSTRMITDKLIVE